MSLKINNTIPISLGYSTLLAPGVFKWKLLLIKNTNDVFYCWKLLKTPTFPVTPGALQVNLAGSGPTDAFVVKIEQYRYWIDIFNISRWDPNWGLWNVCLW
jgi:hypothetical protein